MQTRKSITEHCTNKGVGIEWGFSHGDGSTAVLRYKGYAWHFQWTTPNHFPDIISACDALVKHADEMPAVH